MSSQDITRPSQSGQLEDAASIIDDMGEYAAGRHLTYRETTKGVGLPLNPSKAPPTAWRPLLLVLPLSSWPTVRWSIQQTLVE